jgi:very-short-patch-repair endonuclease
MATFTSVADHARRQHRTISLNQLYDLGLSRSAVRHLERTERLWRVHRGVYALEGPLDEYGRTMAAVLACGERSMAASLTSAVLHRLRDFWPPRPQLLVATKGGNSGPTGVDVRHTLALKRIDVTYVGPIRTTSVARTIRDCAPKATDKTLRHMLRQAEYHHAFDLTTLDEPGTPKNLKRLLKIYLPGSGLTESELEYRFLRLCARAKLPLPSTQESLHPFRVDFIWPELRLIVETDGRTAHDRSIAFTEDRRRDRQLKLAGWTVLRFTWAEIEYDAAAVIRDLRQVGEGPDVATIAPESVSIRR